MTYTNPEPSQVGWWDVLCQGRTFGKDYPKDGQENWYAIWTHGDDPQTVRGPFPTREAAEAAVR